MPEIEVTTRLVTMVCTSQGCGIMFAVPEQWRDKRRDDHAAFYCPNGHGRHFPAKSEAEQLRDDLARVKMQRDQLEGQVTTLRKSETRAKNEVKRVKKRVACGVCLECQRSFTNLRRHMASEHPKAVEAAKQ